jgi:hypothetical protein
MASSRYDLGEIQYSHRNIITNSVVGHPKHDARLKATSFSHDVGFIPAGYEHRPDLISNIFYGTPSYWWLLMEYNNIFDPFEGFNVGDRILIPKVI